jgi:uncharacterized membrane protein YuzA (DUF378 family)
MSAAPTTAMTTQVRSNRSHPGAINALTKFLILVACIGALNWGLVGFFNFNLVHAIFGGAAPEVPSVATRVIYMIVGIAGLISALVLPKLHTEGVHPTHLAR